MQKTDLFALVSFLVTVAIIVVAVVALLNGSIDVFVAAAIVVIMIILFAGSLFALGIGIHAMVKKKDVVHTDSSMTLSDAKEVDREMEEQKETSSYSAHTSSFSGSGLSTDDKKN